MSAALRWAAVAAALLAGAPQEARAQVRLRDLVVNLGASVERYSGNLSAVTAPSSDTVGRVSAVVGEVGVRGSVIFVESRERSAELSFDGGMRQSAALGFPDRDFAPREWAGSVSGRLTQSLGTWGSLVVRGSVRWRSVNDRPPMPLFLQPGYTTTQGAVGLVTRSIQGVSFDALMDLEGAGYQVQGFAPRLDLLDRESSGVEVGARWGRASTSTLRAYGGVRWTEYRNQVSFEPADPFRRDRTTRAGLEWTHAGEVFAQVRVDGTLNRSNSNRPEYDALSVRADLTAPLPADFSLSVFAMLTAKSYVHETDFQRLVPGEEADNASLAYLGLSRPLGPDLDGLVRLGWTRAETDIGSEYFQRFGASLQLNYRPWGN